MTAAKRIAALRDRLEAISDERHFPAHMMSAHEEMCDVLGEMSRMTTQQDSVDVERADVAAKIATLRAEMASGKPRDWYPVHREYLAAILDAAALSLPITQRDEQGDQWQDIASAPDDGTLVLVVGGRHTVASVVKADGDWWRMAMDGGFDWHPTHWMPLPKPPSIEQGDQDGGEG